MKANFLYQRNNDHGHLNTWTVVSDRGYITCSTSSNI